MAKKFYVDDTNIMVVDKHNNGTLYHLRDGGDSFMGAPIGSIEAPNDMNEVSAVVGQVLLNGLFLAAQREKQELQEVLEQVEEQMSTLLDLCEDE